MSKKKKKNNYDIIFGNKVNNYFFLHDKNNFDKMTLGSKKS